MNKIKNIKNNIGNNSKINQARISTFQVMPLDVNIAQMQIKLQNRAEMEIPENGDFSPIIEKYDNHDQRMNISDIRVICRCSDKNKDEREIIAKITNRSRTAEYSYSLVSGTKPQLLYYLYSKDNVFFETIKQFANYISEQNSRKS